MTTTGSTASTMPNKEGQPNATHRSTGTRRIRQPISYAAMEAVTMTSQSCSKLIATKVPGCKYSSQRLQNPSRPDLFHRRLGLTCQRRPKTAWESPPGGQFSAAVDEWIQREN